MSGFVDQHHAGQRYPSIAHCSMQDILILSIGIVVGWWVHAKLARINEEMGEVMWMIYSD